MQYMLIIVLAQLCIQCLQHIFPLVSATETRLDLYHTMILIYQLDCRVFPILTSSKIGLIVAEMYIAFLPNVRSAWKPNLTGPPDTIYDFQPRSKDGGRNNPQSRDHISTNNFKNYSV